MRIQKGKTYKTKCGKLTKILWEFRYPDETKFVAILAPYTDNEVITYYDENGICTDDEFFKSVSLLDGDFTLIDIVEQV